MSSAPQEGDDVSSASMQRPYTSSILHGHYDHYTPSHNGYGTVPVTAGHHSRSHSNHQPCDDDTVMPYTNPEHAVATVQHDCNSKVVTNNDTDSDESCVSNESVVKKTPRSFLFSTPGRLLLGQVLSLIVSSTGVFTALLVQTDSSLPVLQSLTAYTLISVVFAPVYYFYIVRRRLEINATYKKRDVDKEQEHEPIATTCSTDATNDKKVNRCKAFCESLRNYSTGYSGVATGLWKFAAIAIVDLEANFIIVLAYQYTDMTSIQLLDCSSIVFVMIFSYFFLSGVRYYIRWHLIGAVVAVLGMVSLVLLDADGLSRTGDDRSRTDTLLGDLMTVIASAFYAISNVACERVMRVGCGEGGNSTSSNITITIPEGAASAPTDTHSHSTPMVGANDTRNREGGSAPVEDDETQTTPVGKAITTDPVNEPGKGPIPSNENKLANHNTHAGTTTTTVEEHVTAPFNCSSLNPFGHSLLPLHLVLVVEYLFWVSLFGAIFALIQFFATKEHLLTPYWNERTVLCSNLSSTFSPSMSNATTAVLTMYSSEDNNWCYDPKKVAFAAVANDGAVTELIWQFGFGVAMVIVYALMPVLFIVASATFANLSLLTTDTFSIIWNVTIFSVYPKPVFMASFVVIMFGVIVFDTNGFEELVECCRRRRARRHKRHDPDDRK